MFLNKKIKKPSILMILLLIGLPQIGETIYAPALPNIVTYLKTTNMLVQWTLSCYLLGFAVGVLFWGILSDYIGRRKSIIGGLTLYIIAAYGCYSAFSIHELLIARFLQGMGVSVGSVITQTMARDDVYTPEERTNIFAMGGFVIAFSTAIGPSIGGYLTDNFHWQANFAFLLFIACILILASLRRLPETQNATQRLQVHSNKPLTILKTMLVDPYIWSSASLVGISNGILFSYYTESPFIFIRKLDFSPSTYGHLSLFIAFASLLGAFTAKKLKYFEPAKVLRSGVYLTIFASILLVAFMQPTLVNLQYPRLSILIIIMPMMLITFAMFGLIIPIALKNALLQYQKSLGVSGAIFGCVYYILASSTTWMMGALHNGSLHIMSIYFCLLATFLIFIEIIYTRNAPSMIK